MGEHFNPGPSACYRWSLCPGQPNLLDAMIAEGFEPGTNDAAEEGTLCHDIAAKLLSYPGVNPMNQAYSYLGDRADDACLVALVDAYVDRARTDSKGADTVLVEEQLDLSEAYGLVGAFGTGDLIWVKRRTLYIRDAKFGRVYVGAEGSKQLICYGLGALDYVRMLGFDVDTVELSIDQPRVDGLKTWTLTVDELEALRPDLQKWVAATQQKDAPLVTGPVQCVNCPCLKHCPKVKELAYETRQYALGEMGPEQYSTAVVLAAWSKDVIDGTEKMVKDGGTLPGYKLVKSREAPAEWDMLLDPAGHLLRTLDAEAVFKPREIRTPAQIRKALPKDDKGTVDDISVRPPPHTKLAPESDPRPAIVTDDPINDFDEV